MYCHSSYCDLGEVHQMLSKEFQNFLFGPIVQTINLQILSCDLIFVNHFWKWETFPVSQLVIGLISAFDK